MRSQAKALFICVALLTFFASAATAIADAPPSLTIDAPTEVSYQSAHVSGAINPEGGSSTIFWQFQYSTNPSDPFSWVVSSVFGEISGAEATGTDPIPVEGKLTGLTPGTEYAVRLVADTPEYSSHVESPLPNPTFTTLAVASPTVTMAPPSAVTARTAHFEADIDPNGNDPAFNTSWFFSCTPACPGLEGTIPGDGVSHHISVDASGLEAATFYEVTLYASNAGGTGSAGPEAFTTGTEHPTIEKVFVHPLTTEAELVAEIYPGGLETSYHFEYGSTSAYGQSTAVKTLPPGAATKVTANINGLTPGSTYHYRLIAENADGLVESGDRAFTEQSDAVGALPDGRAYELVSNEDNNLGSILRAASSDTGDAAEYISSSGLDASKSAFYQTASVASRSAGGWSTLSLDPPSPAVSSGLLRLGGQVVALSSDLKRAVVLNIAGTDPLDQNGNPDLYLVDSETGEVTWIDKPEALPSTTPVEVVYAGASRDLRQIYFLTQHSDFISGAPGFSMYEWDEGNIQLVSRDVDGTPMFSDRAISPHNFTPYQVGGYNEPPAPHGGAHFVSDDGSTLFFQGSSKHGYGIFARRAGVTYGVSGSQKSGSEGEMCYSTFLGASHDGDLAYFICSSALTDTASEGGGLYSYRLSTGELKQLTPDTGPAGLGVSSGIMSDDASHIYFTATAALDPAAVEGSPNLYVYSGGQTRFIATVPPETTVERTSRSGRFALLKSTGGIAGADPAGHVALYRYDDESQEIVCVSCRSDGTPSEGDATIEDSQLGGFGSAPSVPRSLSDSGRVFFASSDQLTAGDVTKAWDVYEYSEGAPHLLSSGHSQYDSYIKDNSDDGSDVFFVTSSSLLPADRDGGLPDLYDARVGGGFPEAEPEAECVEDGCQGEMPSVRGANRSGTEDLRLRAKRRPRSRLVSVTSRATKMSAVIIVRVSGPGALRIDGRGIRPASRSLKKGGSYRIGAALDPWAKKLLEKGKRLSIPVSVAFDAKHGGTFKRKTTVHFTR